MDELLNRMVANGFADLAGLNVTADIPLRQEVLNEVIAAFLKDGIPSPTAGAPAAAPSAAVAKPAAGAAKPSLDPNALLKLVQEVKLAAHEGKVNVHVVVAVPEKPAGG